MTPTTTTAAMPSPINNALGGGGNVGVGMGVGMGVGVGPGMGVGMGVAVGLRNTRDDHSWTGSRVPPEGQKRLSHPDTLP